MGPPLLFCAGTALNRHIPRRGLHPTVVLRKTAGPGFDLAYPRGCRRAPFTKGALLQRRCRFL